MSDQAWINGEEALTVQALRELLEGAPADAFVQIAGAGLADTVIGFPELPPNQILITNQDHIEE